MLFNFKYSQRIALPPQVADAVTLWRAVAVCQAKDEIAAAQFSASTFIAQCVVIANGLRT